MELRTIVDKITDGTKLILSIPTLLFKNKEEAPLIEKEHIVDKFQEARPDLIAAKYYGNASMLDIILKYNNISNPFSLVEGQTIAIPVAEISISKFERAPVIEENIVKQQFVDTKRLSKKDQKRIEALKKKYDKENLLPPNVLDIGKKTFKFERGRIVFGKQAQSDPVAEKIASEVLRGRKEIPTGASSPAENVENINRDVRTTQTNVTNVSNISQNINRDTTNTQ
jgi:vacuolar-type H+-ATPase subunit I/STV1